MRTRIVAFLIGNMALLYWPYLPDKSFTLSCFFSLLLIIALLYKVRQKIVSISPAIYHFLLLFVSLFLGAIYTSLYLNFNMPSLDLRQIEGKTIQVIGTVDSIPYQTNTKQGFNFYIKGIKKPDHIREEGWDYTFNGKVKLSWYEPRGKRKQISNDIGTTQTKNKKLAIGQVWQLDIRLKKPSGLMNPGGFDYEKWLYQNRILATGYVRDALQVSHIDQNLSIISSSYNQLRMIRQALSDKIDKSLADYPYKGLIKALSIGFRYDMSTEQWKLFLQTGTNHLVAISGLHIGLISSIIWLLVNVLWKSSATLNMKIPAYYVASVFAILAAVIYAALAGFAIPTQRALIMLSVVFVALMLRREISSTYILLLALLTVLIIDPLSPLSLGFWLSFSAVAIIIFSLSGRLAIKTDHIAKVWQLGRLQGIIFVGLLPLMFILFHQFSVVSPLANLVAVPIMSIIIVPMTLLASSLLFIFEPLALLLFTLLKWPIDVLFWHLELLNQLPQSYYFLSEISLTTTILAFIACFWLLMPKGWPGRWLGIVLLLPAIMSSAMSNESDKIPAGDVILTVLDVGQGLSTIIRTQNYSLLYDTGDKFSPGFNMSDMVSIPYLRLKGINEIDKLVLSHSDRDHAGSYVELNQLSIKEVISGEAKKIEEKYQTYLAKPSAAIKQCYQGQHWQWDGVKFEILSPVTPTKQLKHKNYKANNQSCVILVTTQSQQQILLTGDIEKTIEKQLIKNYPQLNADILIVPHHGSKTSSSMAFLKHINPEIAVFSYGYRNRFRHPADKVVKRYKQKDIKLLNTTNGAIELKQDLDSSSWLIEQYRLENEYFWHRAAKYL